LSRPKPTRVAEPIEEEEYGTYWNTNHFYAAERKFKFGAKFLD